MPGMENTGRLKMEVIILAGGLGTRLRDVIRDIPKPMAPVAGRPFLDYILEWIRRYPVRKIIISAGYRADVIRDYFGSRVFDIPVEYVIEKEPLGTGGALKFAIEKTKEDDVLVLNGDTWFPLDLSRLMEFHSSEGSMFTMALKRMSDSDRYGTVNLEGNIITGFNEKKYFDEGLINGGIYVINRKFPESWEMPKVFSLEKDILEKNAGKPFLKGMIFDEPFLDIGIPEDYAKAEKMLGNIVKKKALFLDRDGVINVDKGYVFRIEDFEFIPGIFELCRKYSSRGYLIIVITNQAGIARELYTEKHFEELTIWMTDQFRDEGIEIAKVYHCPHHPYFTGPCDCRKPEPGMLLEAVRDFDLDISQCVLIGDNESDLEAGRRAGIKEENLHLFV